MYKPLLIMMVCSFHMVLHGQVDEMYAYVPSKAPERTADDVRIGILDPVVPGMLDLSLPATTHRVDLLNARGRVKHSLDISQMDRLDLRKLRRGTWTLRAHTTEGMLVRRFFVMGHGSILWEMPFNRRKK